MTRARSLAAALLAAALALLPAPSLAARNQAGDYQTLVLALNWLPTFCAGRRDKVECRQIPPDSFAANNLILHGLWPNQNDDPRHQYGYCELEERELPRNWCAMPAIRGLDAGYLNELYAYMPGANAYSCLHNYEWYKHGSCSGWTAAQYFTWSSTLVAEVSQTYFGQTISYYAQHPDQAVPLATLRTALQQDGLDAALTCRRMGEFSVLSEVFFNLSRPAGDPQPGVDTLQARILSAGRQSSCPESIYILSPQ